MKQEVVIKELKKIAKENNGILDPEIVIESAKQKKSPLHNQFEWDDSEAAHQWRLEQARNLIRVCVIYEKTDDGKIPCRVFVSLSNERFGEGTGYRLTTDVLSDDELRQQMLNDAFNEMDLFRKKYSHLRELVDVFKAMKKAENVRTK